MSIGVTQLILIIIIGILLFGNIPKIFKDVGTGIQVFKKTVNKEANVDKPNLNQSAPKGQSKIESPFGGEAGSNPEEKTK